MESKNFPLPARQVHLDFHTSPLIPGVGADFDPDRFADTFAKAHVQSVTVFAKCHHGMCYYPTKTGTVHPQLARPDLMGDMIEALHRRGIRAPIYTTVGWEEDVADRFPAWRQMKADGTFARIGSPDGKGPAPGGWRFNDFLHPDYQDYLEAHVVELLKNYPVDGLFFDILFFDRDAVWSDSTRAFREKRGLMATDELTFQRFQTAAQTSFAERFSKIIRERNPDASIFYNMMNVLQVDSAVGAAAMEPYRTHWEIESLPSGFWGYYHFPRLARRARAGGQSWLGQTGRFQKMWGDFGGIKPQPALEFECFRSQALGGGNMVGDQLHPRGRLDPNVYQLIGNVYAQCLAAEPFYKDTTAIPQIGIFPPSGAGVDLIGADLSLEGVVQMCEESHYDAAVLDDRCPLDGLSLVILPDNAIVTDKLLFRLRDFLSRGGKLIASNRGGFGTNDKWSLGSDIPLVFNGPVGTTPTYWRTRESFMPEWSESDRVVYQPGLSVQAAENEILVDRVPPYFRRRTDLEYCSHFQAPPSPGVDQTSPAVLAGKQWVYFADPIFREYRQSGNLIVRDAWRAAVRRLIGDAPFGSGLPTTMMIYPRRMGRDLRLTLLHYIPIRKALEIDVIEERSSFGGELLRIAGDVRGLKDFETGAFLERAPGGEYRLPNRKGRLMLECAGYFQ